MVAQQKSGQAGCHQGVKRKSDRQLHNPNEVRHRGDEFLRRQDLPERPSQDKMALYDHRLSPQAKELIELNFQSPPQTPNRAQTAANGHPSPEQPKIAVEPAKLPATLTLHNMLTILKLVLKLLT